MLVQTRDLIREDSQITEDDIIDPQDTNEGLVLDYKHKLVLRHTLTSFDGDPIKNSPAGICTIRRGNILRAFGRREGSLK